MPSRKELELRARVVGIDPSLYANDSKLEQRVLYNEYNLATVTGTKASGTVTTDTTANADGDTVTIGSNVYTFKTALTEAKASQTLTGDNTGNATDNNTVSINNVTYRFKTTIVKPYDVLIGASADATLTNLVSAITGGGTAGTDYANNTPTNGDVTATGPSSHVVTVTALKAGSFANGIALGTSEPTYTWGAATLAGGVQPVANEVLIGANAAASLTNLKAALIGVANLGSTFSSSTAPHPLVVPTTLTTTTLLVNATNASTGIAIATTGSTGAAHLSWGATTLTGNVEPVIAKSTYATNGPTGAAAV